MDLRFLVDYTYPLLRQALFFATRKDPERAHEHLVKASNWVVDKGLEGFLFGQQYEKLSIEISNAAGFNKNGDIPVSFLRALGFDRVVVGTVTGEPYDGNPRPRIKRYASTESMVNWMGLPGVGAEEVAKNLTSRESSGIPLTVNLMSTPGKNGDAVFLDLERTIRCTRDIINVDRYELNISCPNTHSSFGQDTRAQYRAQLKEILPFIKSFLRPWQRLYLKVSPNQDVKSIEDTIDVSKNFVEGFTTTNTTTNHNPKYISDSPGKGGASGKAVYEDAWITQERFVEAIRESRMPKLRLIACGGIDSVDKMNDRILIGNTSEIQVFTPLIYKGPGLITRMRKAIKQRDYNRSIAA